MTMEVGCENQAHGGSNVSLRAEIAAAYRLLALHRFDDLTDGFVSARDPHDSDGVLMGRYGALPGEVRASEIIAARLEEDPPLVHFDGADVDAVLFSLAVYESAPDYGAVIHAHPPAAMVFAALEIEIEPISQAGIMFHRMTRTIAFDEDVSNAQIRTQIGDAIADGARAIILANHGLIVPGENVAEAFVRLYRLNQAMEVQLRALATGSPIRRADPEQVGRWTEEYWRNGLVHNDGQREWPAFLRMLKRAAPGFED